MTVSMPTWDASTVEEALAKARGQFVYFGKPDSLAFMENAGGSQVPACVPAAVAHCMTHNCAQLGAGYDVSNRSTATVDAAHTLMRTWMNVKEGAGEVVMGPSSSRLLHSLGDCFIGVLKAGDEIVCQRACHAANHTPWTMCAERSGATMRLWDMDPGADCASSLAALSLLLGPATKVVAVTHVSNLIGEISDLPAFVKLVREKAPAAQIIVDGVAYAPHRAVDVEALGVDAYVFSIYKVYGPHMAAMFVSQRTIDALGERGQGSNHYFVPASDFVYKFELGSVSHESCAGVLAMQEYVTYLAQLATDDTGGGAPVPSYAELGPVAYLQRSTLEQAFAVMEALEGPTQAQLGGYLAKHPKIRLLGGPANLDGAARVPTFSFYHHERSSESITKELQAAGFAVRNGHMYGRRLLEQLDLARGPDDGVVRISLLHYNTPAEVDRLLLALDRILA